MTTTFTEFLDNCELALNDTTNSVWARATLINWSKEAFLAFPILMPKEYGIVNLTESRTFPLLPDFREIISVEYPLGYSPPHYLERFNRRDADFFTSEDYYDIDYDFSDNMGWSLWTSALVPVDGELTVNYLANHKTNLLDNSTDECTITDEYLHIPLTYVQLKAFRERLSTFMQNPTAYSQIIVQMVNSVDALQNQYNAYIDQITVKLSKSKHTPKMKLDSHDRVY